MVCSSSKQALAEFVGTALLVGTVVGSGIAAQNLSPHDIGLELFENSTATAGILIAIILALGPISGAHFNPIVTIADMYFGGISKRKAAIYLVAQFAGGIAGTLIANVMFGISAVTISHHVRASGPHAVAEVVATFGLIIVIFGTVKAGRHEITPFAVASYIGAAYWFTSSTSFANPAVTVARAFTNSFAGISPGSVPLFVLMQMVGGAIAVAALAFWYPKIRESAAQIVVPHEEEAA